MNISVLDKFLGVNLWPLSVKMLELGAASMLLLVKMATMAMEDFSHPSRMSNNQQAWTRSVLTNTNTVFA